MTAARFDFSVNDQENHQETYDNLREAMKKTHRMCAVVYDTHGPEITIFNSNNATVTMTAGSTVVLSGDKDQPVTANALPLACPELAKAVKPGDEVFVGRYLFTGSETTSVWLKVEEVKGDDIVCTVTNTAELQGEFFTVHAAQVDTDMPILSKVDERHLSTWGVNCLPHIIFLSFTRNAEDVRYARNHLAQLGKLSQSFIFAKIESIQGLRKIDEILAEADGLVLGRGDLGIDLPAEKVFLMQKVAIYKANMAGKPCVISRVVDTMTDTPRPTRAEATDVANAVLDGVDAIMLGAETLRGLYPTETVSTVRLICSEAEKAYNQELYFKKAVKEATDTMSELEAMASSAVKTAEKVHAAAIVVFTSSGRMARLVAKYKPTMPVLTLVIPRLYVDKLRWTVQGEVPAHMCCLMRGLIPMMATPKTLNAGPLLPSLVPSPTPLFPFPTLLFPSPPILFPSPPILFPSPPILFPFPPISFPLHPFSFPLHPFSSPSKPTADVVDNTGPLLGRVGQLQQQLHHQLLPSSQASTHPLPSNPHGPNQAAVRSERSDQVPLSEGSNERIDPADWEDQALGRLAAGGLGGGGGGRRRGREEERSAAGVVDHGGIVPEGVVPDALDRRIPMLIRSPSPRASSSNHHHHQNESQRMSPERLQLPLEALPHAIDSSEQKNVMLAYRERFDKFGDLIRCHGPPCPDFAPCGSAYPNVHACWNEHLDAPLLLPARAPLNCPKKAPLKNPRVPWQNHDKTCSHPRDFNPREPSAMQVFRLHEVMVTHKGFVFNATHRYVHQGCKRFNPRSYLGKKRVQLEAIPSPLSTLLHPPHLPITLTQYSYPQGQKATNKMCRIKPAFVWGYSQGSNVCHFLVQAIPSSLQPLLPSTPPPFNPSSLQPLLPSTPPPFNPSSLQPLLPSTPPPFNPSSLQPLLPSTPPPFSSTPFHSALLRPSSPAALSTLSSSSHTYPQGQKYSYPQGQKVHHPKLAFDWGYWEGTNCQKVHRMKLAFDWGYTQGSNFYHFLVEAIPSFFVTYPQPLSTLLHPLPLVSLTQFSYPQGQKVHRMKLAFDWGYTQGSNFYHFLVEAIPSFFVAAAALPNLRDIPIIAERFQVHVCMSA
ncbi:unnamed protein product [Closterium sp. NIES-64]|nr:unnamed protein product [Closterium sp. NIES-64]